MPEKESHVERQIGSNSFNVQGAGWNPASTSESSGGGSERQGSWKDIRQKGLWRMAVSVLLGLVVLYSSYSAILSGIELSSHRSRGMQGYVPHTRAPARIPPIKIPIRIFPLPKPHPNPGPRPNPQPSPQPIPNSTTNYALNLAISLALDLLAIFGLVWVWSKDEVKYEGRVHGGGREFSLTPSGESGEQPSALDVRVRADWALSYVHDGDRLQVFGKWKREIWKGRRWVEAKRVYNFTTGANWDGKTGQSAANR